MTYVTRLLEVTGAALVVVGAGMAWLPLAPIVAGLSLIGLSVALWGDA
jgi:hypothetical protein